MKLIYACGAALELGDVVAFTERNGDRYTRHAWTVIGTRSDEEEFAEVTRYGLHQPFRPRFIQVCLCRLVERVL